MAEQDALDSITLEAPKIIGFTPVNIRNPLQRSLSKGNEQPAPKRRKKADRSNSSTLSTETKPKRRSSKLTAKITKLTRNDADTNCNVAPKRKVKAFNPQDTRKSRTQNENTPKDLPKATIDRLASFRYTASSANVEQEHTSSTRSQALRLSTDDMEITPPSHQPEHSGQMFCSDTPMSLEDVPSFQGDPMAEQDLDEFFDEDNYKEIVQLSDDPMIDLSFFDAAYNPPSEETVPTQLLGDRTNAENEFFEGEKENGIGVLDNDEEETAALLALADTFSTYNPRAQTCTLSTPLSILIPSTQTIVPESSPIQSRTASTYFSTAPVLQTTTAKEPRSTPSNSNSLISTSHQDTISHFNSLPALPSLTSAPKPFVRGKHPSPLNHRSPIPGLSTTPRILTCFRLGEAINATSRSLRAGHPVQVELYASVLSSERIGDEQYFRFADLWYNPSKGGLVVEGGWKGWNGVSVWEEDGEGFLSCSDSASESERKLCRVVGTVARLAEGGWRIEIGTCWEVTWADVENVRSIVCS
ncbi:hypothetical protein MMC10_005375 [Thelotrema lepadinum]|nr:hypothetical protein [Thelotrema lepadinum]